MLQVGDLYLTMLSLPIAERENEQNAINSLPFIEPRPQSIGDRRNNSMTLIDDLSPFLENEQHQRSERHGSYSKTGKCFEGKIAAAELPNCLRQGAVAKL